MSNKEIVTVTQLLADIRQHFEKFENVKLVSVYEDLYPNKSDVKILFIVGKGEKIGEGGLLQKE